MQDGIVGTATWGALNSSSESTPSDSGSQGTIDNSNLSPSWQKFGEVWMKTPIYSVRLVRQVAG